MSTRRFRANQPQAPVKRGVTRQAARRLNSQYWLILALFVFCLAFYAQTWSHYFVWDDLAYHLAANDALMNGDTGAFWSRPYQDFYSPVVYTVWIWLKGLSASSTAGQGSLRPELFHVANTVLHAANTALVFWLLRISTGFGAGSALGAVVFAIHPMQVESVAWVSELRGFLATLFSLVALMLYWRSRGVLLQTRWWVLAGGSVVAFALALLSKPSVSALPLVLVVSRSSREAPSRRDDG
jgi:protein O-mannosyl-transferase